jgi:hypothetical protein
LPARLVLGGGFTVTDRQQRHLQQQATRLGFADLRACLQTLLDEGWSVPQLATRLDTTQQAIRSAITQQQLQPLPRRQRLARQRQRAAQQRATDRAAILGFEGMRAYLMNRLVTRAWTLRQVEEELGVAPATLRHLLEQYQVRRVAPTGRQRAAAKAAAGPATQAQAVQQRCQARLAELGFADLGDYLRDRYVGRGWPQRRLCVELRVGYDWLNQQLTRLGLRP